MSNLPVTGSNSSAIPEQEAQPGGREPLVAGFVDDFRSPLARGRVIGSNPGNGVIRRGVDTENVLSIDNGALRIAPLIKPGWGRSGIAYGPYPRANGLTFHALVLNGHVVSETTPMSDSFRDRLECWARGSFASPLSVRLREWFRVGDKREMWRRVRMWARSSFGFFSWPFLAENFAFGFFSRAVPLVPTREGNAMVIHAVVADGGELWARSAIECPPTVRGLQNVPFYFTVVLREEGAAYYISSLFPNVPEVPQFPDVRLVAVDSFSADPNVYAGIHQSVLGQIGFRAESRIYGTQVATLPRLANWYGTANAADSLTGTGTLESAEFPANAHWVIPQGVFERTARGVVAAEPGVSQAILRLSSPAGLVNFLVDVPGRADDPVGLLFRVEDEDNFWCIEVSGSSAQLSIVDNGKWLRFASVAGRHLCPHTVTSLQLSDDGENIRLYANGVELYKTTLRDHRLASAPGAGFRLPSGSDIAIRAFEAHPRKVNIAGLAAFDAPRIEPGNTIVMQDDFAGPPGDHDGHATSSGNGIWTRSIGRGVFERTGNGTLRVMASVEQPCPGRTAYLVDWHNPSFADIEVTITPAGHRRGTREKGRSGMIFWQDDDNYLMVSAWVESWPAMSVSAFFRVSGFEELFDAVWTNVGTRMHWGEPHNLRILFDGERFLVHLNNEPVLYRALADLYPQTSGLHIRRVGLIANWEWGLDTGSTFANFTGRDKP